MSSTESKLALMESFAKPMPTPQETMAFFERKHSMLPARIYQYRSLEDYSIEAIQRQAVWMRGPLGFNDPYDSAFAGRSRINKAFELAQLTPNVVLSAIDADVIKTYVSLGLGLGIIASMAFDATRDAGLQALPAEHLFGSNTTRIGLRRGNHIRRYEYDFIELFAPQLTRKAVDRAIAGARPGEEYQL